MQKSAQDVRFFKGEVRNVGRKSGGCAPRDGRRTRLRRYGTCPGCQSFRGSRRTAGAPRALGLGKDQSAPRDCGLLTAHGGRNPLGRRAGKRASGRGEAARHGLSGAPPVSGAHGLSKSGGLSDRDCDSACHGGGGGGAAWVAGIWAVAYVVGSGGDNQAAIARTTLPGAPGRR